MWFHSVAVAEPHKYTDKYIIYIFKYIFAKEQQNKKGQKSLQPNQ